MLIPMVALSASSLITIRWEAETFNIRYGGGKYAATGVIEIVYEEDSFTLEPDARRKL